VTDRNWVFSLRRINRKGLGLELMKEQYLSKGQLLLLLFIAIFVASIGEFYKLCYSNIKLLNSIDSYDLVIIGELFIVLYFTLLFLKKNNAIWFLKKKFIRDNTWLEWPVILMIIVIFLSSALILLQI